MLEKATLVMLSASTQRKPAGTATKAAAFLRKAERLERPFRLRFVTENHQAQN